MQKACLRQAIFFVWSLRLRKQSFRRGGFVVRRDSASAASLLTRSQNAKGLLKASHFFCFIPSLTKAELSTRRDKTKKGYALACVPFCIYPWIRRDSNSLDPSLVAGFRAFQPCKILHFEAFSNKTLLQFLTPKVQRFIVSWIAVAVLCSWNALLHYLIVTD